MICRFKSLLTLAPRDLLLLPRSKQRWLSFKTDGPLLRSLTEAEKTDLLESCPPAGSKVIVGMSGGVDSSVSAALLTEVGCHVKGCWMRNWDLEEESSQLVASCSQEQDWKDAQEAAKRLGIEIFRIDFTKDYWCSVWEPSLKCFENGQTPNPDVLCNRFVKFGSFLEAMKSHGADFVATGHYARLSAKTKHLMRSIDSNKDQSYFLSTVTPSAFTKVCFPVGGLLKPKVKILAAQAGLHRIAQKQESQGVCFIGKRGGSFSNFLKEYVEVKPGRFISVDDGSDLGPHRGSISYTVGQRARIGGKPTPYFVAKKEGNLVYVAQGANHPALLAIRITTRFEKDIVVQNNITDFRNTAGLTCQVRYRGQPSKCCIYSVEDEGKIFKIGISFPEPERSVAEGQTLVLYLGDRCLGGGDILNVHRPFFQEQNENIGAFDMVESMT